MFARPGWLSAVLVLLLLRSASGAAEATPVCFDRDGDALPAGAVDRLGTVRMRHGGPVNAVAFSPSGDMLASGSEDGTVCLWRIPDGPLLRKLKLPGSGFENEVAFLAFTADGKRLAGAMAMGDVHIWEPASGKLLHHFPCAPSQGWMESFALAPDGETVAAGFLGGGLGWWNTKTGTKRRHWKTSEMSCSLAFSADGKVLMSGEHRCVRVWDAGVLRRIDDPPGTPSRDHTCVIALSVDGKTFAHAISNRLYLRDVKTGDCRRELRGHVGKIRSLAFSVDGSMLASADDWPTKGKGRPSIRWWDVPSGRLRHALTDRAGEVRSVAFSPDGKILAAGDDNMVQLWDTVSGRELRTSPGHRRAPRTLAYSPDGRLLASAGDDGVILLWDLQTKQTPRCLQGCRESVFCLTFSPDGRWLASAGRDRQVRLWSPTSGQVVRQWTAHDEMVRALLFSPDGRTLFSGGGDNAIREWDVAGGKELLRLPAEGNWVGHLAWSIPGKVLFSTCNDDTIQSWNAGAGREIRRWQVNDSDHELSLAVSPDGRRLAASNGEEPMAVWEPDSIGGVGRSLHHRGINRLLFSPDGRMLALAERTSGEVVLLEMLTERPRGALTGHLGGVSCLAFSPDGKRLASAGEDTSILIWDMTRSPTEDVSAALHRDELQTLWHQLGERDAKRAYRAVLRLSAHPAEALPYLRKLVTPVAAAERRRVERCIAELDDERFAVREDARRELEELGERAEPILRQALTRKPTLEVRRRIDGVLASRPPLYDDKAPADRLRELRVVEVLERIGSAEARRFLAALAAGDSSARLTREAQAARKRLDGQQAMKAP